MLCWVSAVQQNDLRRPNATCATTPKKPLSPLQAIRESRGMSRTELAQRSSVPLSSVYLLEDRLRDPRASTVLKLAAALKVSTDHLLGVQPAAAACDVYVTPRGVRASLV
jgi:predicted transcriptional regulator